MRPKNLVRARREPTGGNFVVQPGHEELAESLSASATLLVGLGTLEIEEIIETRRILQAGCLQLALSSAGADQIADTELELERQKDADISDQTFCQADITFHRALVDAVGNGMLGFIMYTVIEALVPLTNYGGFGGS